MHRIAVCLVSLTMPAWLSIAARGQSLPPVGANPGAPIWNGSILLNDALAADIAGSGCRLVRVNFRIDGNATWTAGHLAAYDTIIQTARSHNLQIIGLIAYEATPGSQADWNENYNTTGLNAYSTAFVQNAWLLIDRYRNDIKLFEIWNEPDCWSVPPNTNPLNPGCFYIWPRIYANLLAETYKKCIEQGGPDFFSANGISLLTGGLFAHDIGGSFSTSRTYMTAVFNESAVWDAFEASPLNPTGRRYPWDYFGYHFYLNQGQPVSTGELSSYFNDIRAMKANFNDTNPIVVTEFGWNTQSVSLSLQAENLRDAYNWLQAQDDVAAATWYQWNDGDGGWGLTFSVGNPKPSYFEFAAQCGQVGPPVPSFSAAPITGRAPLTVAFTNESRGLIDRYEWTFGDGDTSAADNPSHPYATPGVFTVGLTATGPGGTATDTRPGLIHVLSPADFDGDGDGDMHDFARFVLCFTGPGSMAIPPGCENAETPPAPVASYELATSLGSLSAAISTNDVLAGRIGVAEFGGFHSAVPGGTAGGLADLTDGVPGGTYEAVLADYSHPSLQVRYDLPTPKDIAAIRVFAANSDGRVFQNYDVEFSVAGDPAFQPLLTGVRTGSIGQTNPATWGASLTQITGDGPGPIAQQVDALRFMLHPVSNVAGAFLDAPAAYVGSLIKEIDVIAWSGPPPATNVSDLDGDADADADDFSVFSDYFGGP